MATTAKAPAKIGAIVESAPTNIQRFAPNTAKPTAPAISARKPTCGPNPASRAVAICEGMAIAASVKPATRSGPMSVQRQPAKERSTGQARAGAAPSAGLVWANRALPEGSVPSGT